MEDVQQPTPTPDRETDSLFVPERSATPQRDVSVPVAETGPLSNPRPVVEHVPAPLSPVFAPEKVEAAEQELISPFVQKLRDIEENAKIEMAAWDRVYLGHTTEEITGSVAAGMKRKGMLLDPSDPHATEFAAASEMDSDLSGDDDDDDDDDGEDEVPPLDPNSQKRPKLPIYHPGFKLTENLALKTLNIFVQFIMQARQNGYNDEESSHLWNEIVSKNIPYQDDIKLAVAGDTGAGKSALLNAILGVLNLTIEVCNRYQLIDTPLT
jgi:hypothetical protein